jgi:hypothetical protein
MPSEFEDVELDDELLDVNGLMLDDELSGNSAGRDWGAVCFELLPQALNNKKQNKLWYRKYFIRIFHVLAR